MRRTLPMFLMCLLCRLALAEETIREFSWSALEAAGHLKNGNVVAPAQEGSDESLALSNPTGRPVTIEFLVVDQPGITASAYALRGRMRYEGVEGIGYLEMWSHFPGGSAYFSRTLAEQGVLAGLRGSSGWRDMVLPFSAAGATDHPSRLVVNLVLPGRGKVWIGPLRLVQFLDAEDPLASYGAWWDARQGGLIGGIAGSALGLAGALIGVLCSLGRCRSAVMTLMTVVSLLGATALIAGIVALSSGQPYGVFYPLLLGGGLAFLLFGALRPVIRRRYVVSELRRMTAADAV